MLGEREVTRRFAHTGLVRILGGARIAGGVAYLAMELLDGEDLGTLTDRGRVELGATIAIGAQIADAVAAMHAAEIVHRDLKPENLFLTDREDGPPRIKVLDFGVARVGAPADTAGEIAGTPCYMAPEQWRGTAEPRTDVYGLGCMLYELITGDPPFDGTLPQVMTAHTEDPPPSITARRWIPEPLDRLIMQMLAKSATARPPMWQVARILSELAFQHPPGAALPTPYAAPRAF
jgi:serine/threonine protein kinase